MKKKLQIKLNVLFETSSRNNPDELFGHTETGEMTVIEGTPPKSLIGSFARVRLKELKGKTFRAALL